MEIMYHGWSESCGPHWVEFPHLCQLLGNLNFPIISLFYFSGKFWPRSKDFKSKEPCSYLPWFPWTMPCQRWVEACKYSCLKLLCCLGTLVKISSPSTSSYHGGKFLESGNPPKCCSSSDRAFHGDNNK